MLFTFTQGHLGFVELSSISSGGLSYVSETEHKDHLRWSGRNSRVGKNRY
jgi:hypothetical protein